MTKNNSPRILFWDIETTPAQVYTWGLRDQNISLSQVIESPRVLCFAAKFRGEKVLFRSEAGMKRDEMIQSAWDLLSEADIVVDYNGTSFDVPMMNAEFIQLGLGPPAPFQHVDLYRALKSKFRFLSHKLQGILTTLGFEGKVQHEGFSLWTGCMAGDARAWRKMKQYNIQDVTQLEALYEQVLPWISHPNVALYTGSGEAHSCPSCNGEFLQPRGFRYTGTGRYQRYRCGGCGRWSSSGKRVAGVDVR